MKLKLGTMDIQSIIKKITCKSSHTVYINTFESPVGEVIGAADDEYLYIVTFADSKNFEKKFQNLFQALTCSFSEEKNSVLKSFENELANYFTGKLKKFTVPIKSIGSDFQKEVWSILLELPYGSTKTYGDIAKSLGRPASHSRAVGAACGANAHLLVIPCHRLVSSGGKGGFSSGIDRKEWLIQHEQKFSTS